MKLQASNSNYFCGQSHIEDDSTQIYLVFQPVYKCGNQKDSLMKVLNLLLHLASQH